jgi:predicted membrane protein
MVNSMRLFSMQPLINRATGVDMTAWWIKGIKFVLSFLILTILLALTGGVIKTLLNCVSIPLRDCQAGGQFR